MSDPKNCERISQSVEFREIRSTVVPQDPEIRKPNQECVRTRIPLPREYSNEPLFTLDSNQDSS